MEQPAQTPQPPYFAVIFSSLRTAEDSDGYGEMSVRMVALAQTMPGFLGVESVRGDDGFGITVSYWANEDAIRNWQQHAEHLEAQRLGRERWYARFELRVCRVERAYGFANSDHKQAEQNA
ncbi:MAG TPA: antibiotic biosynthesis monooxygenase [Gemmataceae bacterium]|nr:antibiotic biosynthesis monooxygenase [Gemmataceae bacterium]